MMMMNLKSIILILWWSTLLIQSICHGQQESNNDEFKLDDRLMSIAFDLIEQSSNQTFIEELLNDATIKKLNPYDSMEDSIANVYKRITRSQIKAVYDELKLHNHFIYEPIKDKCDEIDREFRRQTNEYKTTGDIFRLEKNFLETGDKIVSLQKIMIRIINSKLEKRLRQPKISNDDYESSINIIDQFDYLCRQFFGLPPFSWYKIFAPINQLFALIERLQHSMTSVLIVQKDLNENLDGLSKLLHKLRRTFLLYQIGSDSSNEMIETAHLKPLIYQATLGLVDNVGYLTLCYPSTNSLLSQFRFLVQLFSGNLPLNIFSTQTNAKQESRKRQIDPNQLRQLMQTLRQHEQRQRESIEQKRLSTMIENLLENQNKQQQQIDKILNVLASTNNNNSSSSSSSSSISTTTTEKPKSNHVMINRPPSSPPSSESVIKGGETLRQLKQQRKLLNELLNELQKPYNNTSNHQINNDNTMNNHHHHHHHHTHTTSTMNKDQIKTFQTNLGQAQNQLMSIIQNITPLIATMAQLRPPTTSQSNQNLEQNKFDLLNIVQSLNNQREQQQQILLDSSSSSSSISIIDFDASFEMIINLSKRLQYILNQFID